MGRLANKNILITGGNSGIGLAAAQEFDREGARVAICGLNKGSLSPGPTDTAMFGRFPGQEQGEAVKDVLPTNNPSKRMADPLEIAKLAVYLASDDSAYVVGADFLIDGGGTAISGGGARTSFVARAVAR